MNEKQPPYVCHVNDNIEDAIYIGRENGRKRLKRSKWANLYKMDKKRDGHNARFNAINFFNGMVAINYNNMRDDIGELTGKPLACWCRRSDEERTDDNMCHGDVLVELWKEHNDG